MMKIRKIKNKFGLCACQGCMNFIKIKIEIKDSPEWGVIQTKNKFWICRDCIPKVFGWE